MNTQTPDPARPTGPSGSPLLLVIAWLVVVVPAVWGVSQTVQKSMALFSGPTTAATAPASQP